MRKRCCGVLLWRLQLLWAASVLAPQLRIGVSAELSSNASNSSIPVPAPSSLIPSPLSHDPAPDSGSIVPTPDLAKSPAPWNIEVNLPSPGGEPSPSSVTEASNGVEGSCVNRCTARSGNCYCNAACVWYNDCCNDFFDVCNYTTTTTHSGFPAPSTADFTDVLPAPDFSTTSTTRITTAHPSPRDRPAPDFLDPKTPGPTTTLSPWHFSCEDKCSLELVEGTRGGCYCDQSCMDYNDCCSDWAEFCDPDKGYVMPARTYLA